MVWREIESSRQQLLAVVEQVSETVRQVSELSGGMRELAANDQARGERITLLTQEMRDMRERADKQADEIGNLKARVEARTGGAERRADAAVGALSARLQDNIWSVLLMVATAVVSYFVYHH